MWGVSSVLEYENTLFSFLKAGRSPPFGGGLRNRGGTLPAPWHQQPTGHNDRKREYTVDNRAKGQDSGQPPKGGQAQEGGTRLLTWFEL